MSSFLLFPVLAEWIECFFYNKITKLQREAVRDIWHISDISATVLNIRLDTGQYHWGKIWWTLLRLWWREDDNASCNNPLNLHPNLPMQPPGLFPSLQKQNYGLRKSWFAAAIPSRACHRILKRKISNKTWIKLIEKTKSLQDRTFKKKKFNCKF